MTGSMLTKELGRFPDPTFKPDPFLIPPTLFCDDILTIDDFDDNFGSLVELERPSFPKSVLLGEAEGGGEGEGS